MRSALLFAACLMACAPGESADPATASPRTDREFATQTSAPAADYARLAKVPPLEGEAYVRRQAAAPLPADAQAIGQAWYDRLDARQALLGAGLGGKGPDGPVTHLDVGMTQNQFAAWTRANGWSVPRHIGWTFVPSLNLPAVSDAARAGIAFWPASSARTGAQNEALLAGRVELRDGCFWAAEGDGEADRLAFFHAEIGLDRDEEGFFVLRDRVSGHTRARLGEPMHWGGPPSAYIGAAAQKALREACGDAPILVVGSPESRERLFTKAPHLRAATSPPPPPPRPPGR